jgi:hypothetical protein
MFSKTGRRFGKSFMSQLSPTPFRGVPLAASPAIDPPRQFNGQFEWHQILWPPLSYHGHQAERFQGAFQIEERGSANKNMNMAGL